MRRKESTPYIRRLLRKYGCQLVKPLCEAPPGRIRQGVPIASRDRAAYRYLTEYLLGTKLST